ncbi:MAG TPA: hypothetical protein VHR86_03590, partial [Armatimonadota bacterium]|nr:hypothetical protein [Armatimonadota bacterium]
MRRECAQRNKPAKIEGVSFCSFYFLGLTEQVAKEQAYFVLQYFTFTGLTEQVTRMQAHFV